MKVSEKWLREWVSPALDTQALADQITMAGLEVDGIEPACPAFSGVVVAHVVEVSPHPDADKLNVCQVDTGSERVQVVCGARNIASGQRIAFATVGAVLPGDFKIKKAKLRGVESRGMVCAASELGLEEGSSDGILVLPETAPVGEDFRTWLELDDSVIEVDLTPNRGDCLSVRGIAREVGVLNRLGVTAPEMADAPTTLDERPTVELAATDLCPHYLSRIVKGVDVSAPTPLWMQERLRRAGLRSIDIVVDVTNYVLLELGQPLHAFDFEAISGGIQIRRAQAGESLELLGGQKVDLRDDTLIIADDSGPLAIAGIMGGASSGVTENTASVLLEAAFFTPLAIAGRARSYGLHTDASHRFERGVDPGQTEQAMMRASSLLVQYAGGQAGPIVSAGGRDETARVIELSAERIERTLGVALPEWEVVDILTRLGMTVHAEGNAQWRVDVPSWRFDISIDADLIEELARVYGYNNMPVRHPAMDMAPVVRNEAIISDRTLRDRLVDLGYQEAITYSFISSELQHQFHPDAVSPELLNPISSDMAVMRSTLWPGLIKTLQHNLNRQQSRVRLFEIGQVFNGSLDALSQDKRLGGLIYGSRHPEDWFNRSGEVDFFDIKADVEAIMALGGERQWRFVQCEHSTLHPGQSAQILDGETPIGWVGALHPSITQALGLKSNVFVFELDYSSVTMRHVPSFEPLSRYPEVRRDLAIVVDERVVLSDITDAIATVAGEWLVDWRLFDVYQGKGVEPGNKSLAIGLTWQHPSRTLNDDEVSQWVSAIVETLEDRFEASLRR
ncbi:phenylalanine--tRNA ligase subunit beta [Larsenimonas salina]|uniref:phenylalanine--tRNA ligase subunit beta n=1 Tax=Larsenimonas salina TaxID=1295565 RepID=UPI00207342DA|nr:phenylalanine--tRNA ligase subunit beta [Larsenimonas salina]MCM5703411.1 phenylalanine--tRNA ligase subunit beta [Larsenimonas salina]